MSNKGWKDLESSEKAVIAGLTLVQLTLLVSALVDIYRRPVEGIRGGRKLPWVAASFVNYVGPISYFLFGRTK